MINTTLCYIEQDDKILLLQRNKKKNDLNENKWIGVGGKFEPGETPEECLVREVYEETGLTLTAYVHVGLVKFESDLYEAEDMYLFRGTAFTGTLKEDCPEGTLHWVDRNKVLDLPTWEGDRHFLKPLLEGRTNLNMRVCYEGDTLVRMEDATEETEYEKASVLSCPHGFSTRLGGVSDGIYQNLNLGHTRGDIPVRVAENWRRFMEVTGIGYRPFVCGHQVHGTEVRIVTHNDAKFPPCDDSNPFTIEADGYVTNVPNLPIAVFTADCVPVLLEDRTSGVIGALHSGWRSTVADIEKVGIEKMCSLGAHVSDIRIAIGPSIDRCCFEVGAEVTDAVDALIGKEAADPLYDMKDGGKFMLDLRGVIRTRFLQLGIDPTHIEMTGSCTMCHPERYFSHRYTKGQRGSQANMIMLP